jgi:hypothetical protein
MKRIIKSGEIVKVNGIPLSVCHDVEVETHDGNAPMVWDESGEIIRRAKQAVTSPVGHLRDKQTIIRIDECMETIAKTLGIGVDALKAPVGFQNADGIEFFEGFVERLVVALLAEVITEEVEPHGGELVESKIILENV